MAVTKELKCASNIDLSLACVEAGLQAPIISAPGPYDSVPEQDCGNLLVAIDTIDAKYQEQKNALMQSQIEQLLRSDDHVLLSNLRQLAGVLLKNPCYDNVPGVAIFNQRLLVLWLERKQQESCAPAEVDPARVLNLVNGHPFGAAKLAEAYGKTLALLQVRALSGAQAASLQTPAITGETARN
jgi:hypothetical protein